ncbi:MAG: acyl-CoA dehydrogenase family protein [Hyphomicrobiales bacterium]
MSAIAAMGAERAEAQTVIDVARELGPIFARRADERTNEDEFVADNYESLRESGLIEAGVPRELGGGGAGVDELAAMLRTLAYHCGSTALALSMHTHQVAVPAWRWKYQKGRRRGAAAETDCKGANFASIERRVGLDCGFWQSRESGRRLSHHCAQDFFIRRAGRRHSDDKCCA